MRMSEGSSDVCSSDLFWSSRPADGALCARPLPRNGEGSGGFATGRPCVPKSTYPGLFLRGPMVPPYEFHSSHHGRRTSAGPCRLLRLIRRERASRHSYLRCRMLNSRFLDIHTFMATYSGVHRI